MDRPTETGPGRKLRQRGSRGRSTKERPRQNWERQVLNDQVEWKTSRLDLGPEELKTVDAGKGPSRVSGHEEKTREGSSTPTLESTTVGLMSPRESQEKEGGDEGTKVAIDEGAEGSIQKFAENDGGQAGRSGNTWVPQDDMITSEAAEDTQVESTDADVGESTYLTQRVRRVEWNEERVKWSRETQIASTEKINAEIWHAAVLNRRPSADGGEGRAEGATTYGTIAADNRGEDREDRVWWTGWSQWFGWKGWACSKWRNRYYDEGKLPTEDEVGRRVDDSEPVATSAEVGCQTRSIPIFKNLTSFPFSPHTSGCAVWWGWMS